MFSSFGPTELIILLVIVLLIFGPKRLPEIGRSVGSGIRELKSSVSGIAGDDEAETEAAPAKVESDS